MHNTEHYTCEHVSSDHAYTDTCFLIETCQQMVSVLFGNWRELYGTCILIQLLKNHPQQFMLMFIVSIGKQEGVHVCIYLDINTLSMLIHHQHMYTCM